MEKIQKYIYEQVANHNLSVQKAKGMLLELQSTKSTRNEEIAVIGMACKLPGSGNIDEFWNNLVANKEMIQELSENRKKDLEDFVESYTGTKSKFQCSKGGYLKEIAQFDSEFFRISPREAKLMDPIQRMLLEVSLEAFEDAGYGGNQIVGSKTGVFIGRDHTGDMSIYNKVSGETDPLSLTGTYTGILSSRISYVFNLTGPSIVMDTACSSGLVAVHTACESLKRGECDMALAGGAHLWLNPAGTMGLEMVESDDSKVRTFDRGANGTAWGEGICALILKPLSKAKADRDSIYAVIKGTAINNDGASNGITAPNPEAQEAVITEALKNAKVEPESISYIEAHGTGTVLGDPIEIKAIRAAYGKHTKKKQFCGIGSVKTNVGHMVAASGVASLIKVILSLKNGLIPASLNFKNPNPYIEFANTPIYIVDQNQEWKKNVGSVRRGAVSSFGFSGTNCHMIVEEAPEIKEEIEEESKNHLFVLTARNEKVLHQSVQRYHTFLTMNQSINLQDLCYTLSVGRGVYTSRLVILFHDCTDLKQKLKTLLTKDKLAEDTKANIYYGEHRVVQDNRAVIEENEITELNKRAMDREAQQKMMECQGSMERLDIIETLCSLFVKGANVPWKQFYDSSKCRRLHLPVYPLERIRHWPQTMKKQETKIHPLLDRVATRTMDEIIYSTVMKADSHWVITDHKIAGTSLVPATAFLEMAAEAANYSFSYQMFEFEALFFMTPLSITEDETKEVQTILKLENGKLASFLIASRVIVDGEDNNDWVIHAQGKLHKCVKEVEKKVDIPEVIKRCKKELVNSYGGEHKETVEVGPRWWNIKELYRGDEEAVILMGLQDSLVGDTKEYLIHPALMDNAINAFNQSMNQNLYLPFSYKSSKLYQKIPESFYSYVRKCPGDNTEAVSFDIDFVDETGFVFAEITEYTVKKVRDLKKLFLQKFHAKNYFYQISWISKPIKPASSDVSQDTFLIFADNQGMYLPVVEQLKEQAKKVITVMKGTSFEELEDNCYQIGPRQDDYDLLLETLDEEKITKVLHMFGLSKHEDEKQEEGALSLFRFTKAINTNDYTSPMDILVFTMNSYAVTGEEVMIRPENAAMIAMGKVIRQETPNLTVRCIDMDSQVIQVELEQELIQPETSYCVAYRNGKRYAEEIGRAKLDTAKEGKVQWKEDGVYIITGGTGGIGLKIAAYMTSQAKINLCLIGRKELPRREEYENFLRSHESDAVTDTIKEIIKLEQNGAKIVYRSGDVASETEIESIVTQLREQFGTIHGVIHCAGITEDKLLALKQEQELKRIWSPKVLGTVVLDHATDNDSLDFFVVCSSVAAITGGVGQCDYVSANAYMDSYVSYMRMQGKKATAINWSFWNQVGMARGYSDAAANGIFYPIDPANGVHAFACVLEESLNHVIVGELNTENPMLRSKTLSIELSDEIVHDLEKSTRSSYHVSKEHNLETHNSTLVLKGRGESNYSETEKKIASIWSEVLDLNQIDINDEIFTLGGDSIVAIKMVNEINAAFARNLSVKDIFEYDSVEKMATYIDKLSEQERTKEEPKELSSESLLEEKNENKKIYPLSNAQKRIWFLQKLDEDLVAYNLVLKQEFKERLDLKYLNQALNHMIEKHASLRTIFVEEDGIPGQRVLGDCQIQIPVVDVDVDEHEAVHRFNELVEEENKVAFNLADQTYKIKVFQTKEQTCLYLNFHHIIVDGWSVKLFTDELLTLYQQYQNHLPITEEPVTKNYVEWVEQENAWLEGEEANRQREYWLKELSTPLPVLNLPLDYSRPQIQTYHGSRYTFQIETSLCNRLEQLAREYSVTLNVLMQSIYFIFLNRMTQDQDIIIGIPLAGRNAKEVEKVIGLFTNTCCIRADLSKEQQFREFCQEIRDKNYNAFANGRYPFESIVTEINPERDLSMNPIFSTMFLFSNEIPHGNNGDSSLFDLSAMCKLDHDSMGVTFEYNTSLFKQETIVRFSNYLIEIIKSIAKQESIRLSQIDLVPEAEKEILLHQFNATEFEYPKELTLMHVFEEQVRKTPDHTALIYENQTMTYLKFNEKANQLGRLLRGKGVGPDSIVGIMVPRSFEMMIGIYGIMKAGGAYLPIDPQYPKERIQFMLEDSGAKLLLTYQEFADSCGYQGEVLDVRKEELYQGDTSDLEITMTSRNLAYIIYTSGSTGKPKGTMIEHYSVINRLNWMQRTYLLTPADVLIQKTMTTFDVSVWELFWWTFAGASLVLLEAGGEKNPAMMIDAIMKHQVTTIHFVPSMLNVFLEYVGITETQNQLQSLKRAFASGEALSRQHVLKFEKLLGENGSKLINLYGPTEATIDVSYYDCSTDLVPMSIPIGKPIDNIRLYVLDQEQRLQPIGVQGELCIAGDGLARGYLNREQLTGEKFIANPIEKTGRLYRTGDVARYLPDGNIEYLGRMDYQVKIRGFRIELGEVENALLNIAGIKEAAVIDKQDPDGVKLICAYLVMDQELNAERIKEELLKVLPDYMVPAYFTRLEELPLSANGKLNRKALPEIDLNFSSNVEYIAPRNEVESKLENLWKDILGIKQVGMKDSFFDLGGNSLKIITLTERINQQFETNFKIQDLFKLVTIEQIADHILDGKEDKKEEQIEKFVFLDD